MLSPNIGIPTVLNIEGINSRFKFKILIFSNKEKLDENLIIKLIPIVNLRWKINYFLAKRGIWSRIKQFWRRMTNIFKTKEKKRFFNIDITELDKQGNEKYYELKFKEKDLKGFRRKSFRTNPIICKILNSSPISPIRIDNPAFLNDHYNYPQKRLLRLFPDNTKKFFIVELEFMLNKEVEHYLRDYNFILFDILYESSKISKRINYHSLLISNNSWTNFKIVQATDLHLASRNDEFYEKISESYKHNSPELSKKDIIDKIEDLNKRIVNPNNLLRNFIKLMNKRVFQNDLDFIFITGDIVDFTVNSQHNPDDSDIFNYNKSNWKIFKEIILNISEKNTDSEELICPIFTIIGNHDYKPWQYDLNWLGLYKKVGLLKEEAQILKEEYSASPIKAILKSNSSINAYLLEINPLLDYSLKLGNFLFIFLNSGSDSYKEITDYLTGSPSLTGINQRQINFLKNLRRRYPNESFLLCIHGPPINTPLKRGLINRIKKLFKRDIITSIDEFKESNFKTLKDKLIKARIDDKFNMEYGTISSNWESLMKYCYENCILTISGHTHILNEYRLLITENYHNNSLDKSLAVFYDDYSKLCNNIRKILKFKPFIVQTPALGFKSYKKPGRVGGYREIVIKNNYLESFKIKHLK